MAACTAVTLAALMAFCFISFHYRFVVVVVVARFPVSRIPSRWLLFIRAVRADGMVSFDLLSDGSRACYFRNVYNKYASLASIFLFN